jgi:hypothetical protein
MKEMQWYSAEALDVDQIMNAQLTKPVSMEIALIHVFTHNVLPMQFAS